MSTADALTRAPVINRAAACRLWHAVLALVIAAALITQIVLLTQRGADVNSTTADQSVAVGARLLRFFSYFTVQSNLLVLALAISLVLAPARDGRLWRILHADALLAIVVTGLVFGTLLAGLVHNHGIDVWLNAAFHYFAPAWTLAGWLLFGPRPRLDWATIGWMFVWPLLWIVYTFAHGAVSGWYPYPFLDVRTHGYAIAARNTAGVVVLALILIVVLRFLDRRLPPGPARPGVKA